MSSFPFLARLVYEDTWPATTVGVLCILLALTPGARDKAPRWTTLAGMHLGSLLLIVWGSAMYGASSAGPAEVDWIGAVLLGLALLSLVWIITLGIKARHAKWWWLLVINGLAAIALTGIALFISAMAVVDDWL